MHPLKKLLIVSLALFHLSAAAKSGDSAIQEEILVHINQYRQSHGLSKLRMHPAMTEEAKKHSQNMASHHLGFGHQGFYDRIKRLHKRIPNTSAGAENVAFNYKDAKTVVREWLKSPGHKRNIDGHYDLTGIGIARDKKGKIYFTELFLRSGQTMVQRKQRQTWSVPFVRR